MVKKTREALSSSRIWWVMAFPEGMIIWVIALFEANAILKSEKSSKFEDVFSKAIKARRNAVINLILGSILIVCFLLLNK